MLNTPFKHFNEDMKRARDILGHSNSVSPGLLQSDLLRSAWMLGVGAVDAYYCDAYAGLVAKTLQAKVIDKQGEIPKRILQLPIPAVAMLDRSKGGWLWTMAARELMENESILSLEKIKSLFNQFLDDQNKLATERTIDIWISYPNASKRVFGISTSRYQSLNEREKNSRRKPMLKCFNKRYQTLFQRRHDCIHNCDRPNRTIQKIEYNDVLNSLTDLTFLVQSSHNVFNTSYPVFLNGKGFQSKTINRVTQS